MKYNPLTQELFLDDGTFLKKLYCPLNKRWNELQEVYDLKGKLCDSCSKNVYDTSLLNDKELQQLVNQDSHLCLKVDLNQNNVTITYNEHLE